MEASGDAPEAPLNVVDKYDDLAETFTRSEYGDPDRYFGRRATITAELGVRLAPGDTLLDLACADGAFAHAVAERGLVYSGVDLSERMVEVARRRRPDVGTFSVGDMHSYVPPEPVDAAACFRSLHLADERAALLEHVAAYVSKKVVLDVDPRKESLGAVRRELAAAGFEGFAARPFFVPQHVALAPPVAAGLRLAERIPPLARAVLRRRFYVIVAGYRR